MHRLHVPPDAARHLGLDSASASVITRRMSSRLGVKLLQRSSTLAKLMNAPGRSHAQGFAERPITQHDAERAPRPPARPASADADLPTYRRASAADVELVSNETLFDAYGVRRLW